MNREGFQKVVHFSTNELFISIIQHRANYVMYIFNDFYLFKRTRQVLAQYKYI